MSERFKDLKKRIIQIIPNCKNGLSSQDSDAFDDLEKSNGTKGPATVDNKENADNKNDKENENGDK